MAAIPYTSQVDARSIRPGRARLTNAWSADEFGGSMAKGLAKGAAGLEDAGDVMRIEREQNQREDVIYGDTMYDPTAVVERTKQEVGENAEGYKDAVRLNVQNDIDTYLNQFDNDTVRDGVKKRLYGRMPYITNQADTYERKVKSDNSKDKTNKVLGATRNAVRADPDQYDFAVQNSNEIIDAFPDLPAALKPGMKQQQAYDLARDRFEAKLGRARTTADFDAIEAELGTPDWQQKMLPKDYDDTMSKVSSGRQTLRTQNGSVARAGITDLKERSADPTTLLPQEEIAQTQQAVAAAGDINMQQQMARINRDESLKRTYRRSTNLQLQQVRDGIKQGQGGPTVGMPVELSSAVNEASALTGGEVSASYLDATLNREYGSVLRDKPGDYTVKNTESSATGPMQFTDDTFLKLVKQVPTQVALGINATNMTDAQILEYRTKPREAVIAGAILAKQNKSQLEGALGRNVTDPELYMAHFFGAPQATKFIQSTMAQGDAAAATLFPAEAAANPREFFPKNADGKGYDKTKPFTVTQVYSNISNTFTASTSRVTFDDDKMLASMQEHQTKALASAEAMDYAEKVGVAAPTDLAQEGGFTARGKQWKIVGDYYGTKVPPLKTYEEAYVTKRIEEGTTDQVQSMLADITNMGPEASRATFNQLKVKAPAFAQAGLLAVDGRLGESATVIRGYKRMKDNPALVTAQGVTDAKTATDFMSYTGSALAGLQPADAQAAQEAATAYLVETKSALGRAYSSSDYKDAIDKVMGGSLGRVNGKKTLMPSGTTESQVDDALAELQDRDLVALSVTGFPPQHIGGTPFDPADIDEVELRAVGGDKYYVLDGSGAFLWDGTVTNGRLNNYMIKLSPAKVKEMSAKRQTARAEAEKLRTQHAARMGGPLL